MITGVRFEANISLEHEEFSYELEFKLDSEEKTCLSISYNDIPFWKSEFDTLIIDNFDFYWHMGKEVADSVGLHFGGFVECEDCVVGSPEYEILKTQIDLLNKKYDIKIRLDCYEEE